MKTTLWCYKPYRPSNMQSNIHFFPAVILLKMWINNAKKIYPKVAMPPILCLNINFQYVLLSFFPKKNNFEMLSHTESTFCELWELSIIGHILSWELPCLISYRCSQVNGKLYFMAPIAGQKPPCPPDTPTCHAHLTHPPTTHISHRTNQSGSRVYQVGVTDGIGRWV